VKANGEVITAESDDGLQRLWLLWLGSFLETLEAKLSMAVYQGGRVLYQTEKLERTRS
jgi:hypothetical protein